MELNRLKDTLLKKKISMIILNFYKRAVKYSCL